MLGFTLLVCVAASVCVFGLVFGCFVVFFPSEHFVYLVAVSPQLGCKTAQYSLGEEQGLKIQIPCLLFSEAFSFPVSLADNAFILRIFLQGC